MKRKTIILAVVAAAAMALSLVGCGVKITNIAVPDAVTAEKGEAVVLPVAFGTDDAPAVTPETAATGESAETDEKLAKAASKLTVAWTSSDESVATVDATGMVVAVSAGEADITASVTDSEMSAVCKVTVKVAAKDITVPDNLDVKLNDGNETTVEATVSPADATNVKVSYASTDEAVATVDKDGKVQILQPGECDIVTTLTQEGKKVVEKKTHIKAFYEVEGITLDKTEGILTAGNTVTLNATVLPEEIADETIVTWTSSDEKVATVDENGKVTAIAAGEATITANAGEKSTTYKLTVQAKKVVQNTTSNKSSNKGNTSSGTGSSAPASNPAPAQPAAPAEQPSQPTYEEPAQPAPDPQPEQPSNGDNGGSGNSGDKYGEGYDRWGGPVNSAPTDNACPPEGDCL
uniref:Ig-like domain-containing protein n=1 Tax=Gemmiger qucibialis TaxID=2997294 RepID=UPI004028E6BF